ncbi:uncharacterized protein B0H64DRAFT_18357 [Chaetomium fimeti]|uniref:Thioredoxin-like fold domain-containing protein n=1 Tax=Chaetomium fimeti TaxID=1854472 RepID=A0AAE0LWV7_9PEZI|nr:hypothetical protein B0H64DRAFT_18357 [Chaetomium fimeti]
MALPPKFKGHRLVFTDDATTTSPSNPPPHTLEFYLDYVCPFSAKMFNTLLTSAIPHIRANPNLANRLQLIIRPQIQPWHPSSTLVHEAALAVQQLTLRGVSDRFWVFITDLFTHQREYFDEAVAEETRNATYRRLARLARESVGVDEEEVYRLLEVKQQQQSDGDGPGGKNAGNGVTADVKTAVKMARLTGVHVTPTVLFNGVVAGEIASAWTGEEWAAWLDKNIV